jgi:TMEM175 potassium channel family protein
MESGAKAGGLGSRRGNRFLREESEVEFARIVSFSDGVFAIAITLLVLALRIPEGLPDLGATLQDQLPDLFAFALSFAVLARIWLFHHRLFAALAGVDTGLIGLNFLYLALVTLVPFTSEVIGDYDEKLAIIIYAANLGALGLIGAAMVIYAFRRDLVRHQLAAELRVDTGLGIWLLPGVFLLSIPVALIDADAAQWSWLVFFVAGAVALRRMKPGEDG